MKNHRNNLLAAAIAFQLCIPGIHAAEAEAEADAELEGLLTQLGGDTFEKRTSASEAIRELAGTKPELVVAVLRSKLAESDDPEVLFQLKKLLKNFEFGIPVATYIFNEASFKAGKWKLVRTPKAGSDFKNDTPIFRKDGSVEINTVEEPLESCCFTRSIRSENAQHVTVMEARIKILDAGKGAFCSVLTVEDDVHGENLIIGANTLDAYNRKGGRLGMKTVGVWIAIKIVAQRDSFQVFANGAEEPVIDILWTRHARSKPNSWVRFGDTGSHDSGRVLYEGVKVTVFEKWNENEKENENEGVEMKKQAPARR